MNTIAWVVIGAVAGALLAAAVVVTVKVLAGRHRDKRAIDLAMNADLTEPAPHLEDQRLMDGATCFRCRQHPAVIDGLWCASCAIKIHEIDANDQRPLEDK